MTGTTTLTTQYLTFTLDGDVYALDIDRVREVLDYSAPTRVPRMPDFMTGVINLRGRVVPVIDLRRKFGMAQADRTVNTCIIIAEVGTDDGVVPLGCLADSVQEVIDLETGAISPPPRFGGRQGAAFISGVGRRDERFMMVLDIDRLLSAEELERTAAA